MRIHDLEFSHVRAVPHFSLHDLPDSGVVVISGDNETGKSTILDAIWTVLFVRHTADNKHNKPLRNTAIDAPMSIALTATIGPVRFRIAKNYFKSKKAELTLFTPRPATYTGGDAETQLESILREHLDANLLSNLFVRQGQLDASIDAAGISALTAALERSGGTTVDPATADNDLLAEVEKEYSRYYTAGGAPREELKRAEQSFAEAQEVHHQKMADLALLESDIEAYERDCAAAEAAMAKIPAALAEVAERRTQLSLAERKQQQVESAQREVTTLELAVKVARDELGARTMLVQTLETTTKHLATLTMEEKSVLERSAESATKLAAAKQAEQDAAQLLTESDTKVQHIREQKQIAHAAGRRDELAEFLSDLRSRDAAITAARSNAPGKQIPAADVRRAEELHTQLQVATAQRDAVAAKLRLSATEPTDIVWDEDTLSLNAETTERVLTDATTLKIGAVTATFVPDSAHSTLTSDIAELDAKLQTIYTTHGVDSVAELKEAAASHEATAQTISRLEAERAAAVGTRDPRALEQEFSQLEQTLAELEIPTASAEELHEQLAVAEVAQQEAHTRALAARNALAALQDTAQEVELKVLQSRIKEANQRVAEAEEKLREQRELSSDAALEKNLQAAEESLSGARQQLVDIQAEAGDVDVDLAADLLQGAESQVESLRETHAAKDKSAAMYLSQIKRAEGIAEEAMLAEAEEQRCERILASVQRRAAAAKLLRETLLRHRDEARRKYAAPFVDKLSALSKGIFGAEVSYTLDEKLQVVERIRGTEVVGVEKLSGGAQEQLALLARCAIAELVAEESGVPIFLDDALGFTDTHRLGLMNRVLTTLGRDNQVIVLTSMPDRFARVVGKKEFTMSELKQQDDRLL